MCQLIDTIQKAAKEKRHLSASEVEAIIIINSQVLDTIDSNGMTALHYAAFHGQAEAVKVLLDYQMDPKKQDKAFKTPLDYAVRQVLIHPYERPHYDAINKLLSDALTKKPATKSTKKDKKKGLWASLKRFFRPTKRHAEKKQLKKVVSNEAVLIEIDASLAITPQQSIDGNVAAKVINDSHAADITLVCKASRGW